MSLYKELDMMVKDVESQSKQIYPDACDFGVPIFSNDDKIIGSLKGIISQYKAKVETVRYETGATQTIKIQGMFEGEYRRGQLYTVIFTYVFTKPEFRSPKLMFPGLEKSIGYLDVNIDDSKNQKG